MKPNKEPAKAIIARICLRPQPRGHRYRLRGARKPYSMQWSETHKEPILEGMEWDLSNPDERREFGEVLLDVLSTQHEYYFPIPMFTEIVRARAGVFGDFFVSPSVMRHAEDRGFDLAKFHGFVVPTGDVGGVTRADIDRAIVSMQAATSTVAPRFDPKGADAVGNPEGLARTVVRDGAGQPVGIKSPVPYGRPAHELRLPVGAGVGAAP